MVVVDIDRERAKVVSILPYDLGYQPLVTVTPAEAPLATAPNNEEPLKDPACRNFE